MSDKASILKEAQKFLAKGQIDKAILEWEKLLQITPDGNTFNTIGDLHLKKNDKNRAIDQFHRAAGIFRKEGFSLKALAIYKKILNINPSDARSHFALGELNEEKNITTDAIKYYLAASDLFLKANQKNEAVATYQKILALAPNNLSLKLKIAELFSKEGFVDETAQEYVDIARVYEEGGDRKEAFNYLMKALEIKPANRKALVALAAYYEKEGDPWKSLEYIKLAIVRTGKSNDLALWAARLSLETGQPAEAKEFAGSVVQADSANFEAHRILAESCVKEGDLEAAWKEYAPVLDELIFREKFDEAIEILLMFKEVEPVEARRKLISYYKQTNENFSALRELFEIGELYEETGMFPEAMACYKEALNISPEDEGIKTKIAELEQSPSAGEAEEREEKPLDDALTEAEIFLGYGMFDKARDILEGLKLKAPGNIDLHLKLKALYVSTGDAEQAVTECIILSELYKRAGDEQARLQAIREAFRINPDDARLPERFGAPPPEPEGTGQKPQEKLEIKAAGTPGVLLDEYDEELAEADFYVKQGLYNEAENIYRRFLESFPADEGLKARLAQLAALRAKQALGTEPIGAVAEEEDAGFESLALEDVIGAEEVKEPAMESEVLEIFEEFKKGLEKELQEEDTETHYNLGIAYKEMGLLDDAIREFQTARRDPKLFINSVTMLGVCYIEKGLYPLAVEALQSALMKVDKREDAYWGLKYDLADAYERNGDLRKAYESFVDIYGWDSKYRDIGDKVNALKTSMQAVSKDMPPEQPEPEKAPQQSPEKVKKSRVSYI